MRRQILYLSTLLSLFGLEACKQGGNVATDTENDSVKVEAKTSEVENETTSEGSKPLDVSKYWAQFQDIYEEGDLDDIHYPLTKYAFIDIDGDGVDEVWVRTENDEDGAIFCFDDEGEPVLVITECEGKRPSFGKGWVGVGFPAGGPSYYNHYAIVKDSHLEYEFTDFQIEDNHEYYMGETEITEAEAQKIKAGIDFTNTEMKPEWKEITHK
ncbi:MAG: hypothetical protein IKP41_07145 [Bacteroidaceae bacterium]|nr:hypothetical protein [Bacteroidaceae bacterium]